jgi:hypothetical protein
MTMMHSEKMLVGVAGALVLWVAANAKAAESSGTPYSEIVTRNVFALTNPPPHDPKDDIKAPPPPSIILSGIISMPMHGSTKQSNKRALLKVMLPAKPPAKPEEESLILSVGEREGEIEVLEINDKAGIVKVNDFGTITNLSFENNGVKLAGTTTPWQPVPGGPPHAGANGPVAPPSHPTFRPESGYSQRTIPRQMRTGPGGAGASPTGYGGMPTYSAPSYGTPSTMALGGYGTPASTPNTPQNMPSQMELSPENAALMEALYTQQHQKEISQGLMPPIPGNNPLLDGGNTSVKKNF